MKSEEGQENTSGSNRFPAKMISNINYNRRAERVDIFFAFVCRNRSTAVSQLTCSVLVHWTAVLVVLSLGCGIY